MRTVLEDAMRSRYNVQTGGKSWRADLDIALFVSSAKAGWGGVRGGVHGENHKIKLDSRDQGLGKSTGRTTSTRSDKIFGRFS